MKIVYFTHSLRSCWNHGNAHFLRGLLRALNKLGHDVVACEPEQSWSLDNLVADHGQSGLRAFADAYPNLSPRSYASTNELDPLCDGADLVIVHEWNEPEVVAAIGRLRRHAGFKLLFHDTHHRAVSDPDAINTFDLGSYDGVLAFGATLAEVYRAWGWGDRVWVWHEAADIAMFRPPEQVRPRDGVVWIGNWGDGERGEELETFLLRPCAQIGLPLDIYGVRYPDAALTLLARHGARYRGWLANPGAPEVFAQHLATVHVPRRFYVSALPGIPTIRVFEALACGIPLVSAPWNDSEGLFRNGVDFLSAADGNAMAAQLHSLLHDEALRRSLAEHGLETIRRRHTCAHRAEELMRIVATLGVRMAETA